VKYLLAIAAILICLGNSSAMAQQFNPKIKRSPSVKETAGSEAADAKLVHRVDSVMTSLRESIDQGDLFPERFFGNDGIADFKTNTSKARNFKWAVGQITSDGSEVWLTKLSKPNRDYITSGRIESEAVPFLKRQSRRYNALKKQLSGSKTATTKRKPSKPRNGNKPMSDADKRAFKKGFMEGLESQLKRNR